MNGGLKTLFFSNFADVISINFLKIKSMQLQEYEKIFGHFLPLFSLCTSILESQAKNSYSNFLLL